MKRDWKKDDKLLYLPKAVPTPVRVPLFAYFKISGKGSPAGDDFQTAVEALYTLSYALKMYPKKHPEPDGWHDYAVYPLEAVWTTPPGAASTDKDSYIYDIMIRQPEFLTRTLEDAVRAIAAKKKPGLPWDRVELLEQEEGESLQMLHVGSYDDEPRTFAVMDEYCREHDLTWRGSGHKEIYLNDPNRTAPDKLKTVLRYWVKPAGGGKDKPMIRGRHG